jgi:hypothetical protein
MRRYIDRLEVMESGHGPDGGHKCMSEVRKDVG